MLDINPGDYKHDKPKNIGKEINLIHILLKSILPHDFKHTTK